AIMELVARGDGVLRKILVGEGESKPVGSLVGVIAAADENIDALVASAGGREGGSAGGTAPAKASQPAAEPTTQKSPAPAPAIAAAPPSRPPALPPSGPVRSSPLARRMAKESGVELTGIA